MQEKLYHRSVHKGTACGLIFATFPLDAQNEIALNQYRPDGVTYNELGDNVIAFSGVLCILWES